MEKCVQHVQVKKKVYEKVCQKMGRNNLSLLILVWVINYQKKIHKSSSISDICNSVRYESDWNNHLQVSILSLQFSYKDLPLGYRKRPFFSLFNFSFLIESNKRYKLENGKKCTKKSSNSYNLDNSKICNGCP